MRVHLVTSCTNRKRRPVLDRHRIRGLGSRDLKGRIAEWWRLIRPTPDTQVVAQSLYAGEHWVEFLNLLQSDAQVSVSGWVISAGYGLITPDTPIRPYQATFTPGTPDFVCPADAAWSTSDWWGMLCAQSLGDQAIRSLRQLGQTYPEDLIVIAASRRYLDAVGDDLDALLALRQGECVAIFAPALPTSLRPWSDAWIPLDSRAQAALGGSKVSLGIRVAAHALSPSWVPSVPQLRKRVEQLLASSAPPPAPQRRPAGDGEIVAFIRSELERRPGARATPLLRRWRDSGRACEQGRFRHLYERVTLGATPRIPGLDA